MWKKLAPVTSLSRSFSVRLPCPPWRVPRAAPQRATPPIPPERGQRQQGRPTALLGTLLIVCIGTAVGGCESQGRDLSQGSAYGSPGLPTDAGARSTQEGEEVAPEQWDPKEWKPTVSITPNRLSDAEREAWRKNYLESLADDLDGPAPDVTLERWVEPNAEWDQAMSECMSDSGFAVEVDNGAIRYPMGAPPADQLTAWNLAWYSCNAQFTPDPDYSQDWTEEQIGLVYDYWDQHFIPCMEAHGVPVNRTQQPSRESYIATFFTPERTWWPNRYLEGLPESQREQLELTCPPYPPPEVMYGTPPGR